MVGDSIIGRQVDELMTKHEERLKLIKLPVLREEKYDLRGSARKTNETNSRKQ